MNGDSSLLRACRMSRRARYDAGSDFLPRRYSRRCGPNVGVCAVPGNPSACFARTHASPLCVPKSPSILPGSKFSLNTLWPESTHCAPWIGPFPFVSMSPTLSVRMRRLLLTDLRPEDSN